MSWLQNLIDWIFGRDDEPDVKPAPVPTPVPIDPHEPPSPVPPSPVDPVPPTPAGQISASNSSIKITPDEGWRPAPDEEAVAGQGDHEAGDLVRIEVEVRDSGGNPLGAIPIRGIINLQTGSELGTTPKTGATGSDGYAHFTYVMKAADVGAGKLITAVLIDTLGNTITLKPAVLS